MRWRRPRDSVGASAVDEDLICVGMGNLSI